MSRFINKHILQNIWEKSGINNLESREKLFLLGGAIFLFLFILIRFTIIPAIDAQNRLIASIERRQEELITIKELQQEYFTLKKEEGTIQARISQRDRDFSLFTFLDRQAERVQVKKQIQYMKPSVIQGEDRLNETMVEMKFQLISLKTLVDFLRLIESRENIVFIRRISIQENGAQQGLLDVILHIVTFEEK